MKPLALTMFMMLILLIPSVSAGPILRIEYSFDRLVLLLTPLQEKGSRASELAIERISELKDLDEDDSKTAIYELQELLTIVEQNMEIPGNPYKAIRKQQEIENTLSAVKTQLSLQGAKSEEYGLLVTHALMRTDLILKELEFAKQKNKARIDN